MVIDLATRAWTQIDGLGWLLLLLVPLLLLQRALHLEIQAVLYLLIRRAEVSQTVFAVLFLPGVFLHEASHYLMARLLGVRTGRFSLIPKALNNGRLQLGAVETAATDIIRDALIGAAPLLAGAALVAWIGSRQMALPPLGPDLDAAAVGAWLAGVAALPERPDFWLWFYGLFVVSSTMFPSASDRRGWLPVALAVAGLTGVAVLVGAGPWLFERLGSGMNLGLRGLAGVFALSLIVHILLLVPVFAMRKVLNRITGLVVY